jgi:hypothetical protein
MSLQVEQQKHQEPTISTHEHDRLVAAGSLLTGVTLIGGVAMILYGGGQFLFYGGGAFDAVLVVIGILLAGRQWGWVHVAEYVGLTIDERQQRASDARRREWLASIQPYPRFSVSTSVLDDASTRVQCVLHQPVPDRGAYVHVCPWNRRREDLRRPCLSRGHRHDCRDDAP